MRAGSMESALVEAATIDVRVSTMFCCAWTNFSNFSRGVRVVHLEKNVSSRAQHLLKFAL